MHNYATQAHDEVEKIDEDALTVEELSDIQAEIQEQPQWRHIADMEMDYSDGNQLDTDLMNRMMKAGIPPAIENMIGPALVSVQGFELETRTDWRVTPNGEPGGQDVADALNFKLNQAERLSKADRACSLAFRPQIGCGLGWVEVKREPDKFKYPYRCIAVHRNEIRWDMKSTESDLSDARWLQRTRWVHPNRLKDSFPEHKELIDVCGRHGGQWWNEAGILDGGSSTGLRSAWNNARAWTHSENYWYNPTSKEMNIAEVWYRRWKNAVVLMFKDGRIVEYDEDNTGIPYGFVRDMKYSQDSLNSALSKLRWGMSVTRVERTKGAVEMTDDQLRRQVARPDADIVLSQQHMAKPGARFEVKRDYNLTDQHFKMMGENRASIERVSNITSGFQGKRGNATSGRQEQIQVEQSNQTLAMMMDNFREGRTLMGEMLLSMIVEDLGDEQEVVIIEGDAVTADRTVVINKPEVSEEGYPYLSNDVQRTRIKVILSDVPSSKSYQEQQLNALSEVTKSLPPAVQAAVLPYVIALTDTPFKKDIVEAIKQASQAPTPEQTEEQIKEAVKQALAQAGNDIKLRELELKERESLSKVNEIDARSVQIGVQAAYSAMQAGVQIAQMPQIAPIADEIMKGAGYQRPTPGGDDPNFPTAEQTAASDIRSPYIQGEGAEIGSEGIAEQQVQQNTSPMNPPVPQHGASPMQGIETARTSDNFG